MAGLLGTVIATHWGACLSDTTHPLRSRAFQAGLPVVAGAATLLPGLVWAKDLEILSGVAIVTGLLFAALIFLIQMRHQVRVGPDAQAARSKRDKANIDNGFYSSAYATVVGIFIIVALVAQAMLAPIGWPWFRIASNWIIYALFAHFLMTMWLCIRRLWRMYKVFGLNQP